MSSGLLSKTCITTILLVVWNEWEILSLTLGEKYKPRVFENKLMRQMCGMKREEETETMKNLHKDELHDT